MRGHKKPPYRRYSEDAGRYTTGVDIYTIGMIAEDYFGNGLMMTELSLKYGISLSTVSRYIERLLSPRKGSQTEVITLKSKV